MKTLQYALIFVLLYSCQSKKIKKPATSPETLFTIAFGSCNDQNVENIFWNDIVKNKPDVWVWGGDNIYADTEDMKKMEADYQKVKKSIGYQQILKNMPILGTWDDHDYGLNDAGFEYIKKDSSQYLFLNFLDVAKSDTRRNRKGIYHSEEFSVGDNSVKIIILDTRFFRTRLTADSTGVKRYIPNTTNDGTILGETQWTWLKSELQNSTSDFNVIVSSIQFLSNEHGWETWGNMPNEVQKMLNLLASTKAKNVIFLSGDRHISEISKLNFPEVSYPIYDFTSSGLTHAYEDFKSEPNKYRVSKVVSKNSFGLLRLNLNTESAIMELRGNKNSILESHTVQY